MFRLEENFTKFRYEDWLPLSNEDIYQLNEKDFQVINVLQEKFKEDLVDKSYLSMVDLLSINIRNYNRINRKIKDTETSEQKKYPFIIGVAGSVASGKSTFSRILELLLKKSLKGFNIKLLTTDGFLYPNFMQCITRTGRLSSRDPNFQNQPRGGTFPIRKVVSSRFKNGKIIEIDFAQLEFRTAVFLAQDKQGMEDIKNKIDVHQYTADIIGVSRQDAKAHTFKPLYGGVTGTEDEKRYYSKFLEKYKDIKTWHEKLQTEAIRFKQIKLPTGREYAFPYAERTPWGGSTYGTQIKNYPVQGFATADIVPLACINIHKLMQKQKVKSLLVNTVHDSIVADVYPGEEDVMSKIFKQGTADVIPALKQYYNIDFNVPLDTELKIGYDWLNMKEVS